MSEQMLMELSKQEADVVLRALTDECAELGNKGDTEAAGRLEELRDSLAHDRRTGEKLQMDLQGTQIDWVLIAVRNKRLALRKQGKERPAELLLGIISQIVKARDAA